MHQVPLDRFLSRKRCGHFGSGVYMTNHGYDREAAEHAIAAGETDLLAFGTLYLANPDLDVRFARGAALNIPDPVTFYGGSEKRYTDYPFLA